MRLPVIVHCCGSFRVIVHCCGSLCVISQVAGHCASLATVTGHCVSFWLPCDPMGCTWPVVRCTPLNVAYPCQVNVAPMAVGCHWLLLDVIVCHPMPLDAVGCHCMPLDVAGCHGMLLDVHGWHWISLSPQPQATPQKPKAEISVCAIASHCSLLWVIAHL